MNGPWGHYVLSHSLMSDSLQPLGQRRPVGYSPWGFFRQEYWSGLPCPPPGNLPNPEIEPRSSTLQADSLPPELPGKPWGHYAKWKSQKKNGKYCMFSFLWGIKKAKPQKIASKMAVSRDWGWEKQEMLVREYKLPALRWIHSGIKLTHSDYN